VLAFARDEGLLAPQFATNLWQRVVNSPLQITDYFTGYLSSAGCTRVSRASPADAPTQPLGRPGAARRSSAPGAAGAGARVGGYCAALSPAPTALSRIANEDPHDEISTAAACSDPVTVPASLHAGSPDCADRRGRWSMWKREVRCPMRWCWWTVSASAPWAHAVS
jgi:hypothetical protein